MGRIWGVPTRTEKQAQVHPGPVSLALRRETGPGWTWEKNSLHFFGRVVGSGRDGGHWVRLTSLNIERNALLVAQAADTPLGPIGRITSNGGNAYAELGCYQGPLRTTMRCGGQPQHDQWSRARPRRGRPAGHQHRRAIGGERAEVRATG